MGDIWGEEGEVKERGQREGEEEREKKWEEERGRKVGGRFWIIHAFRTMEMIRAKLSASNRK